MLAFSVSDSPFLAAMRLNVFHSVRYETHSLSTGKLLSNMPAIMHQSASSTSHNRGDEWQQIIKEVCLPVRTHIDPHQTCR